MKAVPRGALVVAAATTLLVALALPASIGAAPAQRARTANFGPVDCDRAPGAGVTIVLDCEPGWETGHDRVTIYPRDPSPSFASIVAFADAVWVFDVGATGRASLIVDFHHDGSRAVADLFDDQDGDGAVDYILVDGRPRLTESRFPTVTVTSLDGWWVKGTRSSFNLDISIDGNVRATFGSGLGEHAYYEFLAHDGRPDYDVHVRDRTDNGLPDLDWRQFHPPFPESPALSSYLRTEVMANPEDDERPISGRIFWPYLGRGPHASSLGDYVKGYDESSPPIEVDWAHARILEVTEFVASRGNSGNLFIYSINRVHEGAVNDTNFENPFAFYDLANARDGWPDTSIRFIALLPNEAAPRPEVGIPNVDPINVIQYTWDQAHDHNWSYSLNLIGDQEIHDTITFPEFSVKAVPPDELPAWVARQRWTAATFVEVLARPYWTSEHVYEYTAEISASYLAYRYLLGIGGVTPSDLYEVIAPGFRGEYAFELNGPARVYLSPVDERLHLAGATGGVWDLGEGRELHYDNVGGAYVNHWILRDQGSTVAQLWVVADQAIYADDGEVRIGALREVANPELLTPPRTHEEWTRLGRMLADAAPDFQPDDLRAMFERAVSSAVMLPGAAVGEVRMTDGGFRLLLDTPGGASEVPWLARESGRYAVDYGAGTGYSAQPAVPPTLELTPITVVGGDARVGAQAALRLSVRNVGDVDASRVTVTVRGGNVAGTAEGIGSSSISVPAGESRPVELVWAPSSAGDWDLEARVDASDAAPSSTRVDVAAAAAAGPLDLVRIRDPWSIGFLLAMNVLGVAAVVAAGIGPSDRRPRRMKRARRRHG